MNYAAVTVMKEYPDIVLSYGQSDEYSFIFNKSASLYNRRSSKIMTYVTSLFSSAYVFNWSKFFPKKTLKYPPCFDARIVLYPSDENLRDYLSWRQADVHVNNLYNTSFWNLVLNDSKTTAEAEEILRGTLSADKNELLFSKFGINYNNLPAIYRKGTILLRKKVLLPDSEKPTQQIILPIYDDLIRDKFWKENPELLGEKKKSEPYVLKHDLNGGVENEGVDLLRMQIGDMKL